MVKQTAINIGLHFRERVIDLRIPRFLNEEQLKEVLFSSLQIISIRLPKEYRLKLINKSVEINSLIPFNNYPLSDGDQILVLQESDTNDVVSGD